MTEKKQPQKTRSSSRRDFLRLTAGAAAAGFIPERGRALARRPDQFVLRHDGTYDVVPLRREEITVSVVQSRVRAVDGRNPEPGKRENLNHMLDLIDKAQYFGGRKDLVAFHEFPITGWDRWTRKEILNLALELPGEETEAIGKKAKQYSCYITFGTYAKDKDWPRHIMSVSVIIGPDGKIVSRQWKARNIHGVFPGFELFTTTVYDVLDRYVEMYGWDAVLPVARTDIGNIAVSSVQWEPELYRALTIKGAEIIIRTSTGGFGRADMVVICRTNGVYGMAVNNALSPGNPHFVEDPGGTGGSAIFGPRGEIIAQAASPHETIITARLPLAAFRKRHRIPDVHTALYAHVMKQYQSRYPPNAFLEYLPESLEDALRYFRKKARW